MKMEMEMNEDEWYEEYANHLINMFEIVLKYHQTCNKDQFNIFCRFVYLN